MRNNETSILMSIEEDGVLTSYRLQKSEYAVDHWKSLGNGTKIITFSLLILSIIIH